MYDGVADAPVGVFFEGAFQAVQFTVVFICPKITMAFLPEISDIVPTVPAPSSTTLSPGLQRPFFSWFRCLSVLLLLRFELFV